MPKFERKLMPGQQKGLEWIGNKSKVFLIMAMRCGKTLLTIRRIRNIQTARRVLILCPMTVIDAWAMELATEKEHCSLIHGSTLNKRDSTLDIALQDTERHYVVANFESLLSTPRLGTITWDVVVIDESRRIANPRAIITKRCRHVFSAVPYKFALSGLPNPENDMEFIEQFLFLFGEFMGCKSYWEVRAKYCALTPVGWVLFANAKKKLQKEVHEKAYILTREQAGMNDKRVYETRKVEPTKEQVMLYKEIKKHFSYTLHGQHKETQWALTCQTWLAKLAGGFDPDDPPGLLSDSKVQEIYNLLKGDLLGEQLVIWTKYRHEAIYVSEYLSGRNISNELILGGTELSYRSGCLQNFRSGKSRVLVATERVAKYGVDASAACTAIYYSNEWSYDDRAQSEERILHPKKHDPLLYIDLVTKDTIDEKLAAAVKVKEFNAKTFLTDWLNNFSSQ
jgi:SNF2 family DNA or RNA helicase